MLRRCVVCGSAVTSGAPAPDLHSAGAYSAGAPRLYRLARRALSLFDRHRLALIGRHAPPPARLIDAGAGRGRFVLAAAAAGYDASGVEPSARGALAAAEIGADVRRASIEDAGIPSDSVDVVSLWHVLEHLDDPRSALLRIGDWLAPGGLLLVGVPNLASLQARLGVEYWYHLDVPRHRVHFTPAGLLRLLERSRFTPLGTHHVLVEHNPFGLWQSLVNRFTSHPSYLYNLLKRNAPLRSNDLLITGAGAALAPVAVLVELAAGLAGRGGTVAVVARLNAPADSYH